MKPGNTSLLFHPEHKVLLVARISGEVEIVDPGTGSLI